MSQDAQPSTAAPLAAQPPSEKEDKTSTESDLSSTAASMENSPVSSPPPTAEGPESNNLLESITFSFADQSTPNSLA